MKHMNIILIILFKRDEYHDIIIVEKRRSNKSTLHIVTQPEPFSIVHNIIHAAVVWMVDCKY